MTTTTARHLAGPAGATASSQRQAAQPNLLRQAATALRQAIDPAMFATEVCGIPPDPWQARVLRSDAKRVALVCSRQSGKSTTTAIKAAHTALHVPGSLVLMVAPTQRQSSEIFGKCRHFLSQCPGVPARLPSDNAMSLRLPSGSRVVALPGDNPDSVRGYSGPALVIVDEAAFCCNEILTAIMPTLAVSNGALWLLSTPNGKQGTFYDIVSAASPEWQIERIKASQCPRITADFIAEYTRTRGPHASRAEFECAFLEANGQYFCDEAISAVLSDTLPMLNVTF